MLLSQASWETIDLLRARVGADGSSSVEASAQHFVTSFCRTFSSIALARVFIVLPFAKLPATERAFATRLAVKRGPLEATTRVLTLLGSHGREVSWNDRKLSAGHLAIPLINRSSIEAAPMIAKLLADIDVDLAAFDDGSPIATRLLLGGKNGMFFVPDAVTAVDQHGRHVIANRDFVTKHGIRTVFGMGGAYVDGTLVISIMFTTEALDRMVVDRFPSFIANFKMASWKLIERGSLFEPERRHGA